MFESELVVIALYPGMKEDVMEISASMKINPTIIEWDVAEYALVEHLKRYFRDSGYPDVIISRGAIANLIEQYFPQVASVRAEIEEVALLSSIREASRYGPRLGLLMFEEFADNFNLDASRKLLELPLLRLYPFRTGEDIQNQVRQGKADGLDAMVGTRMAARTGRHIGIPVISPESGRLALQKALKQAVSVIQARLLEKIQLRSYNEAVTPQNETEKTEESRAGPPLSLYIDSRIFLAAACSMSCSASALLPRSADTMI